MRYFHYCPGGCGNKIFRREVKTCGAEECLSLWKSMSLTHRVKMIEVVNSPFELQNNDLPLTEDSPPKELNPELRKILSPPNVIDSPLDKILPPTDSPKDDNLEKAQQALASIFGDKPKKTNNDKED